MKKLFLLFIILLASCHPGEKGGRAENLEFSADWQGAFKTAHDEGRQIFVMFSTEWCPQCEYAEAAGVIRGAMDDLAKSGTSDSGRAARMMKELKQAFAEYDEFSGAVK